MSIVCKCTPLEKCDLHQYAQPCAKCGMYYPGDCLRDGCQDVTCGCDGCLSLEDEDQGEWETHE